ncbi:hypothetical protein BCR35DRAFT_120893 [Leucosporidium creatinivorum]|uniref:Uncharacterized protein n=1 Tax=Leucosporidium creatinivorum TaxID=106004 RepID=A0A1Y2EY58_9BASI|nr:hypothetical protein BCR35DRAFT_120893 [Leucosporidium creatinivorum]
MAPVTATETYRRFHAPKGHDYHSVASVPVATGCCPKALQDPSLFELQAPRRRVPSGPIKVLGSVAKPVEKDEMSTVRPKVTPPILAQSPELPDLVVDTGSESEEELPTPHQPLPQAPTFLKKGNRGASPPATATATLLGKPTALFGSTTAHTNTTIMLEDPIIPSPAITLRGPSSEPAIPPSVGTELPHLHQQWRATPAPQRRSATRSPSPIRPLHPFFDLVHPPVESSSRLRPRLRSPPPSVTTPLLLHPSLLNSLLPLSQHPHQLSQLPQNRLKPSTHPSTPSPSLRPSGSALPLFLRILNLCLVSRSVGDGIIFSPMRWKLEKRRRRGRGRKRRRLMRLRARRTSRRW